MLVAQAESCERGARGDSELGLDDVDTGHLFRDRVLDLDARVALDEEVLTGFGRDKELDRPGVHVLRRPGELRRIGQDPVSKTGIQGGRGRDLHDFLVSLLHGAVPLVKMDHVAVCVRQDLDFDVPRPGDDFLEEQGSVSEGGLGLAAAALERLRHLFRAIDQTHPAPAATGRRLEHDWIAEVASQSRCLSR